MRRFVYTPGEAGQLLASTTLALAIGVTFAGGIVSDRLYRAYGIAGRLALCAGGLALAALTVPLVAVAGEGSALAGVVLATTGLGLAASTGIVVVQDLLPSDLRGFGTGLLSFLIILLGFSIGPTAVAWITEGVLRNPSAIGWSIAVVVASASVIGAGAAVLMRARLKQGSTSPTSPGA